jgi:catechol 2,3-dioxygenase-like lactoylglutathione lyase family enzyme
MGESSASAAVDRSSASLDPARSFFGIHAVDVFVRDQDRSLRFYLDQLGFNLAFDARLQSGDRWVAVAPPDGSAVLSLVAPAADSREYRFIGRPTGIVFVTEDVIARYVEWRKRGVQFLFTPRLRRVKYESRASTVVSIDTAEQTSVWGGIFTRFRDVDGNSFALVAFDEVNREIETQRRRVAEKLELDRRAVQELQIAKQVQARLFPQRLPPMETLEYAAVCIQARQVGGDYHDVLDLGRGRFGLVIADISGKGIAAALLMANLQANLRSQCAIASDDPARLLRCVNQLFYENTSDSAYATLFFAEYDDQTQRLRYANCGHLAALLLRNDGTIERLDSTCTVIGLFKEWNCAISEGRLFPGDTLVLYTD